MLKILSNWVNSLPTNDKDLFVFTIIGMGSLLDGLTSLGKLNDNSSKLSFY